MDVFAPKSGQFDIYFFCTLLAHHLRLFAVEISHTFHEKQPPF